MKYECWIGFSKITTLSEVDQIFSFFLYEASSVFGSTAKKKVIVQPSNVKKLSSVDLSLELAGFTGDNNVKNGKHLK